MSSPQPDLVECLACYGAGDTYRGEPWCDLQHHRLDMLAGPSAHGGGVTQDQLNRGAARNWTRYDQELCPLCRGAMKTTKGQMARWMLTRKGQV